MTLLVDSSVWSLALRRDRLSDTPPVRALHAALTGGESIVTTGLILQELLQGFTGPRARTINSSVPRLTLMTTFVRCSGPAFNEPILSAVGRQAARVVSVERQAKRDYAQPRQCASRGCK